jgi:hypothetical protein
MLEGLPRFDPLNVGHRRVLFDDDRLEGRLRFDLIETGAQNFGIDIESSGQRFDKRAVVFALHLLAREDDIINRTRIDEDAPLPVEDRAALSGNRQQAHALVLRALGVVRAVDDLQKVEPDAQHGQQHEDDHLNDPQPQAQVLRFILKFHKNSDR